MTTGLENITVNESCPTPKATCCVTQLTEMSRAGKCRDRSRLVVQGLEEGKEVATDGLLWGMEMLWN